MEVSASEQETWTILHLIEWSAQQFSAKGFDSARLNAELLLCHVLQCPRIDLYLKYDQPLSMEALSRYKSFLQRRLAHEPLQYIVGETDFMGTVLKVDSRVLIPRPETEILVEHVLRAMDQINSRPIRILDVGTGSGCIAIALAKMNPHCVVDAVDVSAPALETARVNVVAHDLGHRISLHETDFLHSSLTLSDGRYDILVSNPPYISQEEVSSLPPDVRDYEPRLATTDNADGLTFYKRIAQEGLDLLQSGGLVFVEIAYNQGDQVPQIFKAAGYGEIEIARDDGGIGRVVKARKLL